MNPGSGGPGTPNRFPALVQVRGWLLGERLDLRGLERGAALAAAPLTLRVGEAGVAVLFRYGAVVLFNMDQAAERLFLSGLASLLTDPLGVPEKEEMTLRIDPAGDEQIDPSGAIVIREADTARLQIVAVAMAKSMILSHYEIRLAGVFDSIEPLAANLVTKGRTGNQGRELMRHIGKVLLIQHKMVGRVEIGETPELLWEHPELDRLYSRLAEEFELRDRDRALDRKLDIISRTIETLLGLVQSRSSLHVEWYILALIVAELVLSIYPPSQWRM